MFYTGSTSLTGSESDLCVQVSAVSTAWLLDTCRASSADLSLASTDTGIYDLLAVASLTFHQLDRQHTEQEGYACLCGLGSVVE